jgi:hypothetical protein
MAAGSTTARNKPVKDAGKPTINMAVVKNTNPEMMVPKAVNTATIGMDNFTFLKKASMPRKINAVTGLSTMFGINPPGNCVVKPEIIPVTMPIIKTFFFSGKNNTPKNIIVSIMSGFIPKKIPGINVCKAAPIPTKSDNETKTFVFMLISPHLNYSLTLRLSNSARQPIAKILHLL